MSEDSLARVQSIDIGNKRVGSGFRTLLIAEIAQGHDGSPALAHSYIDIAAEAGADAVKFQTHIASAESTLDEPFRVQVTYSDASRYDYWRRMEFSIEEWRELAAHARAKKLLFLSSPFSVRAIEILEALDVPAWKVPSGEIRSFDLLTALAATGKPILLSTGMSSYSEIQTAVDFLTSKGSSLVLVQSTTRYPTPLDAVGINNLDEFRLRFGPLVGLSDHSGTVWPGLAAMARGACVLETHLTLDRRLPLPDSSASLDLDDFKTLASARDAFAVMDAHPVNKDDLIEELRDVRSHFMKSLASTEPLAAGTILTSGMLTEKKPGTGIPLEEGTALIGRRLRRAVTPDRLLSWDDIE